MTTIVLFFACGETEIIKTHNTEAKLSIFYNSKEILAIKDEFSINLPSAFSSPSIALKLKISNKAKLTKKSGASIVTIGDSVLYSFNTTTLPKTDTFRVSSEDEKTINFYVINLQKNSSSSKDITGFVFTVADNTDNINQDVVGEIGINSIDLNVPYRTNLKALVPTISFSGKSINPPSGLSQDFSSYKTYTVSAEDGSTKDYKVNITISGTPTYTVSFNANGGLPLPANQKINPNALAIMPPPPKKKDSLFIDWYSDVTLTTKFDFAKTITNDITLYSKWIKKTLEAVVRIGAIPSDLDNYDDVSQSVLMYYPVQASVTGIYVTPSGVGKKDGTSWTNAYPTDSLKKAIDNISDANNTKIYLVLVAAGVYKAGSTMSMKNNIAIIGGWAKEGNWTRPTTDTTIFDGNKSYRVFQNSSLGNTAVLYAAKIANGGYTEEKGGGMYNYRASPVISHVIFDGNSATEGGGMYNNISNPVITNTVFSRNNAQKNGGGMYNDFSNPVITNTIFSKNTAIQGNGGGIINELSAPFINSVLFFENMAMYGGGIQNYHSAPLTNNVSFFKNIAKIGGG